jgi:hypothetical protein
MTHEEVLEVNQNSPGGHQALDQGNLRAWVADAARLEDPTWQYLIWVILPRKWICAGTMSAWQRTLPHCAICGRTRKWENWMGSVRVLLPAHAGVLYRVRGE